MISILSLITKIFAWMAETTSTCFTKFRRAIPWWSQNTLSNATCRRSKWKRSIHIDFNDVIARWSPQNVQSSITLMGSKRHTSRSLIDVWHQWYTAAPSDFRPPCNMEAKQSKTSMAIDGVLPKNNHVSCIPNRPSEGEARKAPWLNTLTRANQC